MDEFFKDFHQKAIDVLHNVEAAVLSEMAAPNCTTSVRAPFLRQVPIYECDVEDAMIGVWHYENGTESFEICYDQQRKLLFKEGSRKGELVFCGDGESLVSTLRKRNGKVHGTIKLRYMKGESAATCRIVSNFKANIWVDGCHIWGKEVVSWKRREDRGRVMEKRSCQGKEVSIDTGLSTSEQPVALFSSQSRSMPEGPEVSGCPHAKSAPPQELHFVAPLDCTPGQKVCLLGPHGDPVTLALPEGAEPGKPCHICLAQSTFQVLVPEGALPGSTLVFSGTDGVMLNTVVPLDKMPGDSFDLVPPVVIVQVPPLAKAGDDVTFTTPAGVSAMVEVPAGLAVGHYFPVLLPGLQGETRQVQGASPPQLGTASTMARVPVESTLQKPLPSLLGMKVSHCPSPQRPDSPHEDQPVQDSCLGLPQCSKPRPDDPLDIDDVHSREFPLRRIDNLLEKADITDGKNGDLWNDIS